MRENTMTLAGNLTDDPQGLGHPLRHRWRSPFGTNSPRLHPSLHQRRDHRPSAM
jgi:hypothetical protein